MDSLMIYNRLYTTLYADIEALEDGHDRMRLHAKATMTLAAAHDRIPARYRGAISARREVLAFIEAYLHDPGDCPSLLLLGRTGIGKTHEAYAALYALSVPMLDFNGAVIRLREAAWRATTASDLYAALRPSAGLDAEIAFRAWARKPLLLLDDVGAAKPSEWTEEITYRLINYRYNECLPTIITTNAAPDRLSEFVGERCASRLIEMCTRVVLKGPDRRRQGPPA